jgi:hypothetical protein
MLVRSESFNAVSTALSRRRHLDKRAKRGMSCPHLIVPVFRLSADSDFVLELWVGQQDGAYVCSHEIGRGDCYVAVGTRSRC